MERTALPSELVREVQGKLAFEEEQPRVAPINHFPDQQINTASKNLVQKHATAFPTERILRQVQLALFVSIKKIYNELCHFYKQNFGSMRKI